jgi:hypothetical protein
MLRSKRFPTIGIAHSQIAHTDLNLRAGRAHTDDAAVPAAAEQLFRRTRFCFFGWKTFTNYSFRTPERQRQEDVWVNSGEDRVQLPWPVSKNVRKLPRSGLYVSAGHSTLQDNGPGTPPGRTLQNSVRVQFSCSGEK